MPITVTIGSGVLQSEFGKLQAPLASYIEQFGGIQSDEEKLWDKVFVKRKSDHWGEAYSGETDVEDMVPVGESGDYPSTSFQESYSKIIENVTFKQSIRISQEAIEDGKLTDLKKKADKLTRGYHRGKARLMAAMVGNALQGNASFSIKNWAFDTKCADGQCVFYSAHAPKVYGANQSNVYADAFSADNLFKAVLKMQDLKDDNGNTIGVKPDTIIIPSYNAALVKAVLVAIGSLQVPGSGNNDVNPLFGNFNVLVSNYLNDFVNKGASNPPWILLDSTYNEECDGNIYQERVALNVRSELADNDDNVWKARARYGLGFKDWRQMMAFGVTGGSSL